MLTRTALVLSTLLLVACTRPDPHEGANAISSTPSMVANPPQTPPLSGKKDGVPGEKGRQTVIGEKGTQKGEGATP